MRFPVPTSISISLILLLLTACGPAPDATPAAMLPSRTPMLELATVSTALNTSALAVTTTPPATATLTQLPTATAAVTPKPTDAPLPTSSPLPTGTNTPKPSPTPLLRRLRYEFWVTAHDGDLWIPVPQECDAQRDVVLVSLSRPPSAEYVDPLHGNRLLYYRDVDGEISGVYELTSALPKRYDYDTDALGFDDYDNSSAVFRTYTRAETWIEADAPEIRQLAQSIAGDEKGPVEVSQEIYDYIRTSLRREGIPWTGDHAAYRDQYGALATYLRGSGSCQNQALVFVALCRAAGIPTRTVHGINAIKTGEERNLEDWSHSWAEFYSPGFGWLPVDPSGDQFAEISELRIILSFGNNIGLDPPCTSTDWYCGGGDALALSYPVPYTDLRFRVTKAEQQTEAP